MTRMGLIRKSLAVSTFGLINGNSRKQRVARATRQATEAARDAAREQAARQAAANRAAADEKRFRYETDPTYRAWADQQMAAERVKAERAKSRPADPAPGKVRRVERGGS